MVLFTLCPITDVDLHLPVAAEDAHRQLLRESGKPEICYRLISRVTFRDIDLPSSTGFVMSDHNITFDGTQSIYLQTLQSASRFQQWNYR